MTGAAGLSARFRGKVGSFDLDASFEAPARGITALFGPSGCGKTTVLRCIAGLQTMPEGRFSLAGDVWQEGARCRPPHQRPVGYVFQEASLFPHLTVRRNLDYGYRRALKQGAAGPVRFDEVVELLGIEPLLQRWPVRLSGGERQRVAIGRALLSQPRLLLMDEPLAALDRFSKDEILPYLERLRDTLPMPVLYVSHDISEVERLADHIVLLREGRVIGAGPLEAVQADPAMPIARLPDAGVALRASLLRHDAAYGLSTLAVDGVELIVPGALGRAGALHRIRISASDVSLALDRPAQSTILNVLPSRILSADCRDPFLVIVVLGLGPEGDGARILARISRRSWDGLGLTPGQAVFAQIKGMALLSGRGAIPAQGVVPRS
ncbi:MAG: molybdenum ABC transporter ATP-binding protein [Rhodobacteraceae bacterium]|nr:molybdenum ABC transporter ATP-binding protein [Paracoccaceae bacterium]